MFDIGFWELVMIGVVALVVVGPERLPALARTVGLWTGKARQMIGSVKAEIDRELKAEELKRIMQEQAQSTGLHEIIEETTHEVAGAREELARVAQADQAAAEPAAPADSTPGKDAVPQPPTEPPKP
jgi:sec-independent protein translocase protein TatB